MQEIDGMRRQGRANDPVSEEANKMPYLQAVMHEALQCCPAVGMDLPRIVPSGGVEIDGHYIPAG